MIANIFANNHCGALRKTADLQVGNGLFTASNLLRGKDLNLRPLGYEPNESGPDARDSGESRLRADESWQRWADALASDPAQNGSAAIDGLGVRALAGVSDWLEYHERFNPKGQDSRRYRALGNAVTVSVVRWIAKRIAEATRA